MIYEGRFVEGPMHGKMLAHDRARYRVVLAPPFPVRVDAAEPMTFDYFEYRHVPVTRFRHTITGHVLDVPSMWVPSEWDAARVLALQTEIIEESALNSAAGEG